MSSNLEPLADPLREGQARGHLAFCEEVARDGAQARTLLNAEQRIEIARRHIAILGDDAFERLVFAVGFPGIADAECQIIREVVEVVDGCQMMVVCHATQRAIRQAIATIAGARCGRILLVAPTSEPIARCLHRRSAGESLQHTRDMTRFARDLDPTIMVDIALVDAPRADPALLCDATCALTEAGGGAMVLCDTVGSCTPLHTYRLTRTLIEGCDPEVLLGVHLHNDLGLGLASTLEAIRGGIRYVSTSWLGLAERTGMAATEQLLVALASDPEANEERYGISGSLWPTPPRLSDVVPLGQSIAHWLELPLKVTEPVVGTGVNTISTGTPFRDPECFMPYDADALLGVPRRIFVTHLASRKVIIEKANEVGVSLSTVQVEQLTQAVKVLCYSRNQATLSESEFLGLLQSMEQSPGLDGPLLPRDVPAHQLPECSALPLEVMEVAAHHLPDSMAWFEGPCLMLHRDLAAAYFRVNSCDFSVRAWHLDNEDDARTAALWVGLGGSVIADFAADPAQPRIFSWVLSPVPEAAHHALSECKGRDGRWIPTSVMAPLDEALTWIDADRCAVQPDAMENILDLGPIIFRAATRSEALPSYFVFHGLGGPYVQVAIPGRSTSWDRWLATIRNLTGHQFVGVTSANLSRQSGQRGGGTHKDLAEVQADMGYLGIPILAGPITLDGQEIPPENRRESYKKLHASFVDEVPPPSSGGLLPTSTSILALTSSPNRWELVRHGSLPASLLRDTLASHGIALVTHEVPRLEIARYMGDLLASVPVFAGLSAQLVAEVSRRMLARPFTRGELLIEKGAFADRMYFLVSGQVAIEIEPEVRLHAGDYFGEIALMTPGTPRTANVRGIEDGVVVELTAHMCQRLSESFPSLMQPIRLLGQSRLDALKNRR